MTDESPGDTRAAETLLTQARWPITTPRLTLRRAVPDDVDAVWSYRRLASVSRWLGSAHPDVAAFADDFTRRLPMTLVIIRSEDGVIIGDLMLRITDGWAQRDVAVRAHFVQAELGWVLAPDHLGQGYATEAVRALIDFCFGALALRRVTANCFAANESSWRLMERLGMRRESHSRSDALHRELGWQDGYGYALLADEWASDDARSGHE